MLSDEEKKAIEKIEKLIEYLKKWNEDVTIVPKDVKYFEKILDMTKTHLRMIDENIEEILEQSKEIEELKEDNKKYIDLHYVPYEQYISKLNELNKKWKDKIKAKIEEVEQWELYNMKIPKLSTLDERLGAKVGIKYILQSLLEKE